MSKHFAMVFATLLISLGLLRTAQSLELLVEAESFEGVHNVSSFSATAPWSMATAGGLHGLKSTASAGEAIYLSLIHI